MRKSTQQSIKDNSYINYYLRCIKRRRFLLITIMKLQIIKDLFFTVAVLCCMLLLSIPYLKIIIAAGLTILYAISTKEKFKSIGFSKQKSWIASLLQSIAISLIIVALSMYIIRPLTEYITNEKIDSSAFRPLVGNANLFGFYLLIGWLVGGISEELIFRGFLMKRITTYIPGEYGIVFAIVITSSLFGYLHSYQGLVGQIQTGIIGAMLASIYFIFSRRLMLVILTHGFVNTISFSLIYFEIIAI